MNRLLVGSLIAAGIGGSPMLARQASIPPAAGQVPPVYKFGTFEREGRTFVGIVLQDSAVIDFSIANEEIAKTDALYPSRTQPPRVAAPVDMMDLISRYGSGLRQRSAYIAGILNGLKGPARPRYVYDLATLRMRPPVRPGQIVNAAVNYRAHGDEMAARGGVGAAVGQGAPQGTAPPGTQ